jgi:hypothetical protein
VAERRRNPRFVLIRKVLFRVAFAGFILLQIVLLGLIAAGISTLFPSDKYFVQGVRLYLALAALLLIGASSYLEFRRMTRAEYVSAESEKWLAERRHPGPRLLKRRKTIKKWAVWIPTAIVVLTRAFFGRSVVLCITRITSTLWQINRIPSFDPTHLDHPLLHIQYLQWRICPLDRCSRTIQRPIAGVEPPIRRGKAIVLRFDDEFSQHTSRRSARNEASQHEPLGRHAAVWERDHHLQGRGSASLDDRATIHPLFHADRQFLRKFQWKQ